jgi:hypothetical protein
LRGVTAVGRGGCAWPARWGKGPSGCGRRCETTRQLRRREDGETAAAWPLQLPPLLLLFPSSFLLYLILATVCLQFMDSRSISIASLQVFSFFFLPRHWALGSNLTPDEFLTIFCQFFLTYRRLFKNELFILKKS